MNTAFLKCIAIIATMGLINSGCKKSEPQPAESTTYKSLSVLELQTNLPLAGARVKIYECKTRSYSGCSELLLLDTVTTDTFGRFRFDSKWDVYIIRASQDKYWDGYTGGVSFLGTPQPLTNIFLTPIAYTKIHLRKVNPHSPGVSLFVEVIKDSFSVWAPPALLNNSQPPPNIFSQPVDSNVIVPSFGNADNLIRWSFIDSAWNNVPAEGQGEIPLYFINRFDTASVEINY